MDLNQQMAQLQQSLDHWNAVQRQITGQPLQAQQSSVATIAEPQPAQGQDLLLKLYDEFVKTDEGKQLAANLSKFARFAQSKVDRKEV